MGPKPKEALPGHCEVGKQMYTQKKTGKAKNETAMFHGSRVLGTFKLLHFLLFYLPIFYLKIVSPIMQENKQKE